MTACLADAAYPVYHGRNGRFAQFWADADGSVHVIVYGGVGRVLHFQVYGTTKEAYAVLIHWLGTSITTG